MLFFLLYLFCTVVLIIFLLKGERQRTRRPSQFFGSGPYGLFAVSHQNDITHIVCRDSLLLIVIIAACLSEQKINNNYYYLYYVEGALCPLKPHSLNLAMRAS